MSETADRYRTLADAFEAKVAAVPSRRLVEPVAVHRVDRP